MSKSTGIGRGRPGLPLTHGMARAGQFPRSYKIWRGMRKRCSDLKDPDYGGRGISICERWESYENFLSDMGEPPVSMSLERKNNELGYSPENCRWATQKEQTRNTRRTRLISWRGRTQSLASWAEEIGCSYRFMYRTYRMI
jgi:hypothetical protein